jgi:hypothetical protein
MLRAVKNRFGSVDDRHLPDGEAGLTRRTAACS